MKKKVSLVVPVFNEEDNLHEFHKHATAVMQQEAYDYNIIFVDDGSRDSSALILAELSFVDFDGIVPPGRACGGLSFEP